MIYLVLNNKKQSNFNYKKFISDRVKRTEYLKNYVPNIIDTSDNFYTYDFIEVKFFQKSHR